MTPPTLSKVNVPPLYLHHHALQCRQSSRQHQGGGSPASALCRGLQVCGVQLCPSQLNPRHLRLRLRFRIYLSPVSICASASAPASSSIPSPWPGFQLHLQLTSTFASNFSCSSSRSSFALTMLPPLSTIRCIPQLRPSRTQTRQRPPRRHYVRLRPFSHGDTKRRRPPRRQPPPASPPASLAPASIPAQAYSLRTPPSKMSLATASTALGTSTWRGADIPCGVSPSGAARIPYMDVPVSAHPSNCAPCHHPRSVPTPPTKSVGVYPYPRSPRR